jgi:hypothetical protein
LEYEPQLALAAVGEDFVEDFFVGSPLSFSCGKAKIAGLLVERAH